MAEPLEQQVQQVTDINNAEEHRKLLSIKLRELLGSDHVYFQPPESVKMIYPCFRYSRGTDRTIYANNMSYLSLRAYDIVYISLDPTDPIPEQVPKIFSYCRMARPPYVAEGLYHTAFTIYW